jgi:Xaa-Pro aminopeptidase
VIRLRAGRPGALGFKASFASVHPTAATLAADGEFVLRGQLPGSVARRPLQTIERAGEELRYPELYDASGRRLPHVRPYRGNDNDGTVLYGADIGGRGMRFEARLAVQTDGRVTFRDGVLQVEGEGEATLLLAAGSSFNGFDRSPSREGAREHFAGEQLHRGGERRRDRGRHAGARLESKSAIPFRRGRDAGRRAWRAAAAGHGAGDPHDRRRHARGRRTRDLARPVGAGWRRTPCPSFLVGGIGPRHGRGAMSHTLDARRARVAAALPLNDALLVVGAGAPVPLPEGSDQTYPFRAHAEYVYLTGGETIGGVLAFDPRDGPVAGWVSFVPQVTESERYWEGRTQRAGTPIERLPEWLAARAGRSVVNLGSPWRDLPSDRESVARIRDALQQARRRKDGDELALIRRAAAATAAGYARLRGELRPGVSERALQIELEAEFFRHGATRTGYGTIVGSGPNAAVLHFAPSARAVRDGEFVLVDAGAEIDRYMADVTRTYVAGTPGVFQRDLHQVVLGAQERAIQRCVAGAEWKEIHLRTAVDLVGGLVTLGVMRGSPEVLVEREAHALFFPHGLGHMVGLGVRDGSGLHPGRQRDPRSSLRSLRMDLPLAAGYVVTVEPGLYFIPELLNEPGRRERYRDCVNWERVDTLLGLGGVRIEDDVLVTDGAPEVLTAAIPKGL